MMIILGELRSGHPWWAAGEGESIRNPLLSESVTLSNYRVFSNHARTKSGRGSVDIDRMN